MSRTKVAEFRPYGEGETTLLLKRRAHLAFDMDQPLRLLEGKPRAPVLAPAAAPAVLNPEGFPFKQ